MYRVFVFGTLKDGFPNHAVNQGRRLPGTFRTCAPLPLYLVGERCSPWLLDQPGEGHQVLGEVFEVDADGLAAMDVLERVDRADGYQRVEIDVEPCDAAAPGGGLRVHAYLKAPRQLLPDMQRLGPLAVYTLEHARLYKPRQG
ncbi:MAG: gamma-glutamylcyclotransferase [Gammaproteobacteria bacterium]|nr:gamma-glutamylcyclotransferase [Gammaproteobacteria bacterium]